MCRYAGPYKGPVELDADVYRAQCELIVSVVQALSDLGELRLPGSLMPHEFLFVREQLGGLLKRREIALAAQFLEVRRTIRSRQAFNRDAHGPRHVLSEGVA